VWWLRRTTLTGRTEAEQTSPSTSRVSGSALICGRGCDGRCAPHRTSLPHHYYHDNIGHRRRPHPPGAGDTKHRTEWEWISSSSLYSSSRLPCQEACLRLSRTIGGLGVARIQGRLARWCIEGAMMIARNSVVLLLFGREKMKDCSISPIVE
jgi:hypothetical protein